MWAYLIPIYLGVAGVLQGGFNRQIAATWGLPGTVLLNSIVLIMIASVTYLLARVMPEAMPKVLQDQGSFREFNWWYLLPGVFGYTIIAGLAFSIRELGVAKVIVMLIGAQLTTSVVWDAWLEGIGVTWVRAVGAMMAFGGALIVAFAK